MSGISHDSDLGKRISEIDLSTVSHDAYDLFSGIKGQMEEEKRNNTKMERMRGSIYLSLAAIISYFQRRVIDF